MHFYHEPLRQTEPVGNNAIAYDQRMALWSQGKLFLPPLIDGTIDDLTLGENIVFEEVEDEKLISCKGLQNLLRISHQEKTIFIADNHHHALYFRYLARDEGLISRWVPLLHVDQHADMNEPAGRIDPAQEHDLWYIAAYVNTQTQIASFIQPALRSGILSTCVQIRSEAKLQEIADSLDSRDPYILDIDIDFFAHEENIQPKISLLQKLISSAQLVTVATSPSFIDQERAMSIIQELCK